MTDTTKFIFFFFNDTATTEIYTLSLHDALPISEPSPRGPRTRHPGRATALGCADRPPGPFGSSRSAPRPGGSSSRRSEEHTSELQSRQYLVCRLLLEKKKNHDTFLFL